MNSRGLKLFTCKWLPKEKEPKALIFICHGYAMECSITMNSKYTWTLSPSTNSKYWGQRIIKLCPVLWFLDYRHCNSACKGRFCYLWDWLRRPWEIRWLARLYHKLWFCSGWLLQSLHSHFWYLLYSKDPIFMVFNWKFLYGVSLKTMFFNTQKGKRIKAKWGICWGNQWEGQWLCYCIERNQIIGMVLSWLHPCVRYA